MSASPEDLGRVEGMAFQLLLQKITGLEQKVTNLERAMESLPPLLQKIITQLEAQAKQPEVPVATYAQLYPELEEPVSIQETGPDVPPGVPLPERPSPPRRWWSWFTREER